MKRKFYSKRVKRIKLLFLFTVILILPLFISCAEEKKAETGRLAKTYVDLSIAREKYIGRNDSLQTAKEKIYSKYNFTEEEFERSMKSLEPRSEVWDRFFIQANEYIDSIKAVNASR